MKFMLKDHPRPNIDEFPDLYSDLDELCMRVQNCILELPAGLFHRETGVIQFSKMSKEQFEELVVRDPDAMVVAFTRVCGLTDREFETLCNLKYVYRLRKSWSRDNEGRNVFTKAITDLLPKRMNVETFLYAFYKMWEEHQKRFWRAELEEKVRTFFQDAGYDCKKITRPTEVNGAIPPEALRLLCRFATE